MPSTRSTQPRLVTEPTMKPMLEPPRHSSTRLYALHRLLRLCAGEGGGQRGHGDTGKDE